MNDLSDQSTSSNDSGAAGFPRDDKSLRWLGTATVVSLGLVASGYLLGNGLLRAKEAERAVTVRGLAERNVTADLATWTISYSDTGPDLAAVQAKVRADTQAIEQFFAGLGFPKAALQPTGANVSTFTDQLAGPGVL